MDQVFGLPFLGAISAFGWAAARVLMDGLTGAAGGWLFPTVACAAGFWALSAQITEGDGYVLYKHIAAIALAAVLLYAPSRVNLSGMLNGQTGAYGYLDESRGAAPFPTQFMDWIGTAVERAVKQVLMGADKQLLPLLDSALKEAAADRATFQDAQVAMNVAAWRLLVSSALQADSTFAAAADARGLRERLLNPAMADPYFAGAQIAGEASSAASLLSGVSLSLPAALCRNTSGVADLAAVYSAVPWTLAGDCTTDEGASVSVLPISSITRTGLDAAGQSNGGLDATSQRLADRSTAVLSRLFSAAAPALDASSFSDWSALYRAIGAATLVASAVQLGRDVQFKILLGGDCENHGDAYCTGVFAVSARSMESYVTLREDRGDAPWYEEFVRWFGERDPGTGPVGLVSAAVGSLVSVLTKLVAHLVASLTPYALAAARAVAVLLAVLGIYLLLIPGRTRDALGLLVGPMAWVHVWTILFVIWYPLEMLGEEAASRVPEQDSFTSFLAGRAVVRFVFAMGYASLPYIAWKIVFGGLSRTVPRLPVDRMVAPARNYIVRHFRRLLPAESRRQRSTAYSVSSSGPHSSASSGRRSASAGSFPRRVPSNPPAARRTRSERL